MEGGDEQLWKSSKYIGRVDGGKVAEGVSWRTGLAWEEQTGGVEEIIAVGRTDGNER